MKNKHLKSREDLYLKNGKIRVMPLQLREIGFHVQNHATQWHGFQHEIQFQEIVVAWIQLTLQIKVIPFISIGCCIYLVYFIATQFSFHFC